MEQADIVTHTLQVLQRLSSRPTAKLSANARLDGSGTAWAPAAGTLLCQFKAMALRSAEFVPPPVKLPLDQLLLSVYQVSPTSFKSPSTRTAESHHCDWKAASINSL